MNTTDLWEDLGSLADNQASQVLTQLFARYEQRREQNPADPAAESFFQSLAKHHGPSAVLQRQPPLVHSLISARTGKAGLSLTTSQNYLKKGTKYSLGALSFGSS